MKYIPLANAFAEIVVEEAFKFKLSTNLPSWV
jgi:hypothetical protein